MKKKTLSAVSSAYLLAAAGFAGCETQENAPAERPEVPETSPVSIFTPEVSPEETTFASPVATLSPAADDDEVDDSEETGAYRDGSYSAEGGYQSPAGPETVGVELAIADGVITAVTVTPQSENSVSAKLQGQLAAGIGDLVIGQPLETIEEFDAVNGSSLSPEGFQEAVEKIKEEAAQSA